MCQAYSRTFVIGRRVGTTGIVAGLAGRYATALFDLAKDGGKLDSVGQSLARVRAALAESAELRALVSSPLLARQDAAKGVAAVADTLGLDPLTKNFLGVLAANRRLTALGDVMAAYDKLAADHRGETTAEVTSAHPLSADQVTALKAKLKAGLGREVMIDQTVDPSILGGLIVKVGSKMIDSSLRTKIDTLGQAMKG